MNKDTQHLLRKLYQRGACIEARLWVQSNSQFSPKEIYEAVQRIDWMIWILDVCGHGSTAFHFSRLSTAHRNSAWFQKNREYRRFVNKQLCDLVRYRVPFERLGL